MLIIGSRHHTAQKGSTKVESAFGGRQQGVTPQQGKKGRIMNQAIGTSSRKNRDTPIIKPLHFLRLSDARMLAQIAHRS